MVWYVLVCKCIVIAKGREGNNIQGRDRYRCTMMWVQVGPIS